MELYFKELISEEASLDKLVDDLAQIVQGADGLARSIGVNLSEEPHTDIARRLLRLKEGCTRIHLEIVARARAADQLVRGNPYSFIGTALVLGMLVGARAGGRK
jgi:ElaB/YqjD/DUF883 family membrane-anchored ribosome-binding protein